MLQHLDYHLTSTLNCAYFRLQERQRLQLPTHKSARALVPSPSSGQQRHGFFKRSPARRHPTVAGGPSNCWGAKPGGPPPSWHRVGRGRRRRRSSTGGNARGAFCNASSDSPWRAPSCTARASSPVARGATGCRHAIPPPSDATVLAAGDAAFPSAAGNAWELARIRAASRCVCCFEQTALEVGPKRRIKCLVFLRTYHLAVRYKCCFEQTRWLANGV